MSDNIIKRLRAGITGSVALSAVLAIISPIAIFVISGILNDPFSVKEDGTALAVIALVAWDLLRMSGFGMFICGLISVIFELFGKAHNGKLYSIIMLLGSVFGLISGFILSIESMLKKVTGGLWYSFDFDDLGYEAAAALGGSIMVACVFSIVSAVIVFVALGIRSSVPHPVVYPQQYQQYPQQGYPQQYPQQSYPQQYPQQSVPVQPPVDFNKPGDGQ